MHIHLHLWSAEKHHSVSKQIPSVAKLNKYKCTTSFFLRVIKSVFCPFRGQSVFSSLALPEASDILQVTWVTPTLQEDVLTLHPPQLVGVAFAFSQLFIWVALTCEGLTTLWARGSLRSWTWKPYTHNMAISRPDKRVWRVVFWPSCPGILGPE